MSRYDCMFYVGLFLLCGLNIGHTGGPVVFTITGAVAILVSLFAGIMRIRETLRAHRDKRVAMEITRMKS